MTVAVLRPTERLTRLGYLALDFCEYKVDESERFLVAM